MFYQKPEFPVKRKSSLTYRGGASERGAVLIVALIILLLMSMIGVSNMQSSTMQERMAGNTKQKTLARTSAESALKAAETWLRANVTTPADLDQFDGNINGLYSAVEITGKTRATPVNSGLYAIEDVTNDEDWGEAGADDGRGFDAGNILSADTANAVSQQPRYVIEYIGRESASGARIVKDLNIEARKGDGDIRPFLFRITAIGWGQDANIYTVLESTFRTGYGPGFFTY